MPTDAAKHQREDPPLGDYEMPKCFIEPAVRACRMFNTAIDLAFYNVPNLWSALLSKNAEGTSPDQGLPLSAMNFDALHDPEGSLLLIDASQAPWVHRFTDLTAYLTHEAKHPVNVISITGVGSSALGSAAFAWDLSVALQKPVLAIVPGYGVADVLQQAWGGWFAYGLHDFLQSKSHVQDALLAVAPNTAAIGRALSISAHANTAAGEEAAFRHGSGSADVLHALLQRSANRKRLLVGHSKGALQINNAIRSLNDESKTANLGVVTLGCPIATDVPGVRYFQYLGLIDALGQLNAWGHRPDQFIPTWHSTDLSLPATMAAGVLTREALPDLSL